MGKRKRAAAPDAPPADGEQDAGPRRIRVVEASAYADPGALVELAGNPRQVLTPERADRLDRSLLSRMGLFRPLLAWKDAAGRLVVIGGNQRLVRIRALMADGVPLVLMDPETGEESPAPGVPITLWRGTEADARVVALRDNNSDGDWDWSELSRELEAIAAAGGEEAIDLAGFDESLARDLVEYGAGDEARLMEAGAGDPIEERAPTGAEAEAQRNEDLLTAPGDRLVGVAVGHVRGRIRADTYRRLVGALAVDLERKDGLDAAFSRLLDRVDAAPGAP